MGPSLREVIYIWCNIFYFFCESIYFLIFPPPRQDIRGRKVLVTGAGHGIGREFCLEFARLGAKLVQWDINKDGNEETANAVRKLGGTTTTYICDVSSADDVHKIANEVKKDVGDIDILINNAGILYGGALLDMQEKHIRRTFDVNTLSQFWTVREFLPAMLEANKGIILNVASASARSGTAFLVDYSASKYAVYGFTEALREELDTLGKSGVQTTCVCPMFVNTGLCKYPKDRFNKILTPKETALGAIDGMLRGENIVYVPWKLWFQMKLIGIFPEKVAPVLKKIGGLGIDVQYNPKSK